MGRRFLEAGTLPGRAKSSASMCVTWRDSGGASGPFLSDARRFPESGAAVVSLGASCAGGGVSGGAGAGSTEGSACVAGRAT